MGLKMESGYEPWDTYRQPVEARKGTEMESHLKLFKSVSPTDTLIFELSETHCRFLTSGIVI